MNLKSGLEKALIVVAVSLLAFSFFPLNAHAALGSLSVEATLFRSPETVFSGQASLIFAHVPMSFGDMHLSTTVTLTLKRGGSTVFSNLVTANLPLLAVPWVSGWYVTSIPGLPAYTLKGVLDEWKVSTRVDYALVIDRFGVASGSYDVVEGEAIKRRPFVYAMVEEALQDMALINETFGLGPKGWVLGANKPLNVLIFAVDSESVQDVSFEFCLDGGSWNALTPSPSTLMAPINNLLRELNDAVDSINGLVPPTLPKVKGVDCSIKILSGKIPGQHAGHYVMFRANATDGEGNTASSPSGLYYVVNDASNIRVLIVDPHVKLWLLQSNINMLIKSLSESITYKIPNEIKGNLTILSKVADVVNKYSVEVFHHWELLGKHFNLYVAWPKALANLLKNQSEGGFEPNIIYLSNLWLGLNATEDGSWNWDLNDMKANDKTVMQHLIDYVGQKHAGLIASHGTLSDWVVWASTESSGHYKIGSRGHVGDSLEEVNPADERTVASLLGLPEIALWEYFRDKVAYTLCTNPETQPLGMLVGSTPLQVPYIPFNGSMKTTIEAKYIEWEIPEEFNILIPSIYNEFGIPAYTQVGWQLAMPRALAYTAWRKAQEMSPLAEEIYGKLSKLVENITQTIYSSERAMQHINASLGWGLHNLYWSIVSANISGTTFSVVVNLPNLNKNLTYTINVSEAYDKLLQLLPVKLVALSTDGLAGIIVHDKYWNSSGYRSVYLSFEAEAVEGGVTETLMVNAVEWCLKWQYRDVSSLLGELVRVPKELEAKFNNAFARLVGNPTVSKGLLLNEEGYSTMELPTNTPGTIHILLAHPTTDEVEAKVLEGQAEFVNITKVDEGLTQITMEAPKAGQLKLGFRACSESALNPAYISVKLKAAAAATTTITFSAIGLGSDASDTVLNVDGANYHYNDLPKSFTWDVGSFHRFEWLTPVSAGMGKQYIWVSTSGLSTANGGTLTVPSEGGSVAANYKAQYYFSVSSAYGSPAPTSGWFDAGTSITASVTSPFSGGTGTQYVCTGWSGTGSIPSSGFGTSVAFTINAPSSITWNWKTQYYLMMDINPSDAGTVSPSSGWYDEGATMTISATANAGYKFNRWSGTGTGSYTGTDNQATITMNGPIAETANFVTTTAPPPSTVEAWLPYIGIAIAVIAISIIAAALIKRRK